MFDRHLAALAGFGDLDFLPTSFLEGITPSFGQGLYLVQEFIFSSAARRLIQPESAAANPQLGRRKFFQIHGVLL